MYCRYVLQIRNGHQLFSREKEKMILCQNIWGCFKPFWVVFEICSFWNTHISLAHTTIPQWKSFISLIVPILCHVSARISIPLHFSDLSIQSWKTRTTSNTYRFMFTILLIAHNWTLSLLTLNRDSQFPQSLWSIGSLYLICCCQALFWFTGFLIIAMPSWCCLIIVWILLVHWFRFTAYWFGFVCQL